MADYHSLLGRLSFLLFLRIRYRKPDASELAQTWMSYSASRDRKAIEKFLEKGFRHDLVY